MIMDLFITFFLHIFNLYNFESMKNLTIKYYLYSGPIGLIASALAIIWCTYSSSTMFVTVLQMSEQRLLVAYPVGLLYVCFALMTIF